jgi:hypothetical protein
VTLKIRMAEERLKRFDVDTIPQLVRRVAVPLRGS